MLVELADSVDQCAAWLRSLGGWGIAGSIALMVAHSFLPFPAEILALANGMVYGPVWGAVITWVGAMIGEATAFALVRALGRPLLHRFLSANQMRHLVNWSTDQAGITLLVARLIPMIAFNLVNYAAALAMVSWWTFLWSTALGILPLTVLLAIMGDQILTLPGWIWLLLAVAAIALWIVKRIFWPSHASDIARRKDTHPGI